MGWHQRWDSLWERSGRGIQARRWTVGYVLGAARRPAGAMAGAGIQAFKESGWGKHAWCCPWGDGEGAGAGQVEQQCCEEGGQRAVRMWRHGNGGACGEAIDELIFLTG
jgi:hypothetical protein